MVSMVLGRGGPPCQEAWPGHGQSAGAQLVPGPGGGHGAVPHTALPALPHVLGSAGLQHIVEAGRTTSPRMTEGPGPPPAWTGWEGTPGRLPCVDRPAS